MMKQRKKDKSTGKKKRKNEKIAGRKDDEKK